jgi:hypothetical protein
MAFLGKIIKRGLELGATFDRDIPNAIQYQTRTLRYLLRKASQTSFGQYYKFKEILDSETLFKTFQENVPVFDYDRMHDKWWHMSLNNVENVSWRGHIDYFALSSGTSGAPSKHIPVSEEMIKAMRKAGMKMFFALTRFDVDPALFTKDMLMLGGTSELVDQGGYYKGDLSGINASKPPFWLRPYYKPGNDITKINNWEERINQIVKRAPEWDVGFLVGIPAWLQLMMERIVAHHKLDHLHQLWPNLSVYVHGGVAFEPYRNSFEQLLARPLTYMNSYLASEGFIAYQNRPDTRGMRLLLNNGIFFEFIPFDPDHFDENGYPLPHVPILTMEDVQEGQDYALLISTCSGAWRYMIGDTIRFSDLMRSEIVITGRTKHFLSICGEHLSIDNMNQGLKAVDDALGLNIREFTVAAIPHGAFFAHRWYISCEQKVDKNTVRKILDEALCLVNADYQTERQSVLRDIEVNLLPVDIFYKWQKHQGKIGGQNKFPRVMKPELFEKWEAFVQQHHSAKRSNPV